MASLLLICATALLVWGSIADTFGFEFKGLAGLVLGADATSYYSIVKLDTTLPASARDPDSLGVRWIQLVFILFTVVMPLFYMAVMLFLWVYPMTLQRQRQVFVLSEILYAWSALDVFVVSIFAAVLQISKFAMFMVGHNCDSINPILAAFLDGPLQGDDKCFDLVAHLGHGCAILFCAAGIYYVVGQVFFFFPFWLINRHVSCIFPSAIMLTDYQHGISLEH